MNLYPIHHLAGKHQGDTLHVIGRGPSLARLEAGHLGPGPVIALSYAIQKVEPFCIWDLYSLQKDWWYCETRAPILAHAHESLKNSAPQFAAHDGLVYGFDNPRDFGLEITRPSLVVCVELARLMGCAAIRAYCCDAMTTGEQTAYQGGQIVEVKFPGNYPANGIQAQARAGELGLPLEWVTI